MSLERILSLVGAHVDIPTEKLSTKLAKETLESLESHGGKTGLNDITLQNIQLLNTLLQHNSSVCSTNSINKGYSHTTKTSSETSIFIKLWKRLIHTLIMSDAQPEAIPQTVIEFLVTCVSECSDGKEHFLSQLRDVIAAMNDMEEREKCSFKCQNVLGLIETFLRSPNKVLAPICRGLLLRLSDVLLSGTEALIESPLFIRITGMISFGVRALEDEKVYHDIWRSVFNCFTERGHHFVKRIVDHTKNTATKSGNSAQFFLVLLDLLLEVSLTFELKQASDVNSKAGSGNNLKELLCNPVPWTVIQHGLSHENSFSRKQALYDLKKCLSAAEQCGSHLESYFSSNVGQEVEEVDTTVSQTNRVPLFFWDKTREKELLLIWKDFLLIMETLEENQLHVITPVLKRLDALVAACCIDSKDKEMPLHTSWVCVILQRMLSHESKAITQEGVVRSLMLDVSVFPLLKQETIYQFLCSGNAQGLIPALHDVNLYSDFRSNSSPISSQPEIPKISQLLQEFLRKCMEVLQDQRRFFRFILQSVSQLNWGSVPLYFVCLALSRLQAVTCLTNEDLQILGSIMTRCSRTHDSKLRSAIQCLLLRSLILFTDCSKVAIDDVFRIILLCNVKHVISQSTSLYKQISDWLRKNMDSFQDVGFLQAQGDPRALLIFKLEEYLSTTSNSKDTKTCNEYLKDAQPCALLISLTLQDLRKDDIFHKILLRLSDITDKASTHLYMPAEKVFKAVAILHHLLAWCDIECSENKEMVWNCLYKISQGLVPYIARRLLSSSTSFDEAELCLSTTKELILWLETLNPKRQWQHSLASGLAPLIASSNAVFRRFYSNVNSCEDFLSLLLSVKCLTWSCLLQQDPGIKFSLEVNSILHEFLGYLDLCASLVKRPVNADETWGKMVEQYMTIQWTVVPYIMYMQKKALSSSVFNPLDGLKNFLEVVDVITEENLPICLNALRDIIPAVLKKPGEQGETLVCECLDMSWKLTCTTAHSPAFWVVYPAFVKAAFQESTLCHESPPIQEKLTLLLTDIVTMSAAKPALLHHVCDACIKSWFLSDPSSMTAGSVINGHNANTNDLQKIPRLGSLSVEVIGRHVGFVVQCLTFCHSYKKEDLALCNALKIVDSQNRDKADRFSHLDTHDVTISTIAMLLELDEKSARDCELGFSVVQHLLQLDDAITERKARYHHNSIHHHMKNKVYQAIILLLPFIPEHEGKSVIEFVLVHLKNDAQPSVRYLMEWSLALLLHKFPSHDNLLLSQLRGSDSEDGLPETPVGAAKFSAVCSYLTSALLLGLCRMHKFPQDQYFLQLLDICLPWCMSQHFSIRLYALAVVLRIKYIFDDMGKTEILLNKQPALPSCLLFADKSSGNVGRNWFKMKDNFFLFELDPLLDLSVETVYGCLPRLCCVPNYVSWQTLRKSSQCFASDSDNHVFKTGTSLFNKRDKLRNRTSTKWIPQESKQTESIPIASDRYRRNYGKEDDPSQAQSHDSGNVQKKIMPWLDAMEEANSKASLMNARGKGLILVASLIDKPSNLGGLTRTCEIFGAEALVVQSLACTTDKLYQSLSVTAHKWLPMKEVKPWQLEEYLGQMRREGYTLIGTEQTAQSVCLSTYKFPERCVIVLGNEKEGIPIPILKFLNVCVQIPQKGIVRSLNVHVSGAITVWEYARQSLLH